MNVISKTLFALALVSVSAAASANEGALNATQQHFDSTLTRADVVMQTQQARAAGLIGNVEADYIGRTRLSVRSRAEVRSEYEMAVRDGTLPEVRA